MSSRHGRNHFLAAGLGLLALAMQALLPLFIAVEIRAMAAAELGFPSGLTPESSCLHGFASTDDSSGGTQKPDDHGTMAGCPLCTALASAVAVTPPGAPGLPLPTGNADALRFPEPQQGVFAALALPYRSRAPPRMASASA